MNQTQLMIGEFPFTLSTTEYNRLNRTLAWRWQSHERLNRKPALQYQGPDSAVLTPNGAIHIKQSSDLQIPDLMQREADKGEPLILLVGNGLFSASYGGQWVITDLSFDDSDLLGDGTPLTIDFSMTLKQWGEDEL